MMADAVRATGRVLLKTLGGRSRDRAVAILHHRLSEAGFEVFRDETIGETMLESIRPQHIDVLGLSIVGARGYEELLRILDAFKRCGGRWPWVFVGGALSDDSVRFLRGVERVHVFEQDATTREIIDWLSALIMQIRDPVQ